jgi:hypothetical protein
MEQNFITKVARVKELTYKMQHGQAVNQANYEALSKNAFKLARNIVGKNLPPRELLREAEKKAHDLIDERILKRIQRTIKNDENSNVYKSFRAARNKIYKTRHANVAPSVTKIQRAFRASRLTDNKFLKMMNKRYNVNDETMQRLEKKALNFIAKKGGRNLENTRKMIYAKKHANPKVIPAVLKIQRAFQRKHPNLTNEQFLKLRHQNNTTPFQAKKLANFVKKETDANNISERVLNRVQNLVYARRHAPATNAIKKIQSAYKTRYASTTLTANIFLKDLEKDGRFKFYVKLFTKLLTRITKTLGDINEEPVRQIFHPLTSKKTAQNIITNIIGPCHIKPDNVPRKYLIGMKSQLLYVARAYQKMTTTARKEYRDRLDGFIGGLPCLENAMDSLVQALYKPTFEWIGKKIEPLSSNNKRYLGSVMAKAVTSWVASGDIKGLPGNLNARKNMFWKMVRNKNLHVLNSEGAPGYSTPAQYNKNGTKFKTSELANSLEYITSV